MISLIIAGLAFKIYQTSMRVRIVLLRMGLSKSIRQAYVTALFFLLGVMGWLMIVTIPIGLGVIILYILIVAGYYIVRRVVQNLASGTLKNVS